MILKVARLGHPVLRKKSQPVKPSEIAHPRFQSFLDDLAETMREYRGVGIAAPQVHVPRRVFLIECVRPKRYPVRERISLYIVINPRLEILDRRQVGLWEGCLSIPEMRGWTPRYRKVRVRGFDRKAQPLTVTAEGFHARILQHEFDHLEGRVYLDRMDDMKSLTYLEHLPALEAKR